MGIKLQSGSGDLKNNDIKSYILSLIQIPLWNKYLKPRLIDLGLKTNITHTGWTKGTGKMWQNTFNFSDIQAHIVAAKVLPNNQLDSNWRWPAQHVVHGSGAQMAYVCIRPGGSATIDQMLASEQILHHFLK